MTDVQLALRYTRASKRAQKRGIAFDLSWGKYKRLMRVKKCNYTGHVLTEEAGDFQRTLERVDPKQGYIDNNTIVTCRYINIAKNNLSPGDIKSIYQALKRRKIV